VVIRASFGGVDIFGKIRGAQETADTSLRGSWPDMGQHFCYDRTSTLRNSCPANYISGKFLLGSFVLDTSLVLSLDGWSYVCKLRDLDNPVRRLLA